MTTMKTRFAASISGVLLSSLLLTGCIASDQEYEERKELQSQTELKDSLEQNNLGEKRDRENNPTAQRYVYLMNFGTIVGYYIIVGKVSSSGSQIAPEQEVIRQYSEGFILDSAKDDGTYGDGDPGIFFFTADGIMVETSLDYVVSDAPLAIDVPRLEVAK
jgi:hypothetical protein